VLRRDDRTRVGQFEDIVHVIADNTTALNAAASHARNGGFPVEVRWRKREGEASDLGRQWVEPLERRSGPVVVLGGGEATVTVREDGLGGRNTEFALSAAVDLDRRRLHGWSIASLATDGQDAQTGSAGAIVTSETIRAAKQQLLDPAVALQRNDSASLLAQTGDLLVTGPTGTNVNDLYFAVNLGDIC
jgi:glycerate 2-kinase